MTEFDFTSILRPELSEFSAYVPHSGHFHIRLDANEPPPLLSQHARARLATAAGEIAWERYPDATAYKLRQKLAATSGVTPEEILVGVGSDELIALLLTATNRSRQSGGQTTMITCAPSFIMYRINARIRGLKVVEIPLDDQWDLPVDAFRNAVDKEQPNVIFIATPNNPTGNLMAQDRLAAIIESAPQCLVVIDEAYIEYALTNHLNFYQKYPNVVLLRTLSKLGFAALRLGWLIGRPPLVCELNKVRTPYNMNTVTQHLGELILEELWPEVHNTVSTLLVERARMSHALSSLGGFSPAPSHANFLWVRTERPAAEWFDALAKRGILLRSFHDRGGRLAQYLRITIGSQSENDRLLEAIQGILHS